MNIFLNLFIFLTLLLVFSQFGHRLSARHAIPWWLMTVFIGLATLFPQFLVPITHSLGIQLVSNLVLATISFFLFLQVLELTSENSTVQRKLRTLTSRNAAIEYSSKSQSPDSNKPSALIILPCYNEEAVLESSIEQMQRCKAISENSPFTLEFCFVNDGSHDQSREILEQRCPLNFTSHSVNVGVAGVLMTGFMISQKLGYDYVVQCDSDGQHPAELIPELLQYADQKKIDMLIGSRFAGTKNPKAGKKFGDESTTLTRILGIRLIRYCLYLFSTQTVVRDPTSGFRVYSKQAQKLLLNKMPDDYPEPESIAILALHRLRIEEYAVKMRPRLGGVSSLEGLKTVRYMTKVLTALIGLRMRSLRDA